MHYTTQGLMTADDIAEVRRDMDLDLCPCCEGGRFGQDEDEPEGVCVCGHGYEAH